VTLHNLRNPSLSGAAPAFSRYMQRGVWAESAFGESSSLPSWLSDDSQTDASATVNKSRG